MINVGVSLRETKRAAWKASTRARVESEVRSLGPRVRSRSDRTTLGFTLVELLVVTLIIMLLAGLLLSALAGALEEARVQRTQGQIAKIHQMILSKYEGFRTRRVMVPYGGTTFATAQARLDAIRALIRAELPDRITDIDNDASESSPPPYFHSVPLLRRIHAIRTATGKTWTTEYQGAEALYLILSMPQEDGAYPLEFFKQNEIGDLDNDGMKEILDGWGNPIRFLRWAPGFESPLQPINDGTYARSDPFDPFYTRVAVPAGKIPYPLVPLIMSGGADGLFEVAFDNSMAPVTYASLMPPNDPFYSGNFGVWVDENSNGQREYQDNLHNHIVDGSR